MVKVIFLFLMLAVPAFAAIGGEALPDPAQEKRAVEIGGKLRCVVCEAQSINGSDASLAADMRREVRERIAAGETDEAIIESLRARYGDFILLEPPMRDSTYLLWFGPGIVLLLGAIGVVMYLRRRPDVVPDGEEPL